MLQFIDTHTHNTDEAFEGCADELIGRALEAGVVKMLLPDIDSKERDAMFAYARRHADVCHPMLGLYPGSVDGDWREEIDRMCAYDRTGVVAVGEIGLDYHYGTEFKKEQQEALRVQLELASQWDLPVNIHLREATGDFLDIVRDCRHLHLTLIPLAANQFPVLLHLLQLFFQLTDPAVDQSTVHLQLFLTRATGTNATSETGQRGTHTDQSCRPVL